MEESTKISNGASGANVLSKTATGDAASRLRAEAATLSIARHPGVVELLGVEDEGGTVRLEIAHVAGRNLLDQPPLNATQVARIFAEIAQTVADLHELGIAHANIGAEHVILDRHLHTTLCGFGNAERSETGPATAHGARVDVVGLGRLLDHELRRSLEDRASDERSPLVIGLQHVADLADSAADVDRVITMEQLAHRLHQLSGTTAVPHPASGDRSGSLLMGIRDAMAGKRSVVGIGLAIFVCSVAALMWASSRGTQPNEIALPEATSPSSTSPSTTTPVLSPVTVVASLLTPATVPCRVWTADGPNWADVDGDGCDEPWQQTSGGLVVADERFELGSPGDLVVLGDWNCDGAATVALLNADTGAVFFFDDWASDRATIRTTSALAVGNAVDMQVVNDGACDKLAIETGRGTIVIAEPEA